MSKKWATFIISHGRPDNVVTLDTLLSAGYTGDWYIVLDNLDTTAEKYINKFGSDKIVIFNKHYYADKTDYGLSVPKLNSAVFARNAVEDIAKELQLDGYICLDDDIRKFIYRYEDNNKLRGHQIKSDITEIFNKIMNFIINTDISCASCGYQQIYMSGLSGLMKENSRTRLLAEAFFRNLKFDVNWIGNTSEDYLTSIECGRRGQIFIQLPFLQVDMPTACTGKQDGGNSDIYRNMSKWRQLFFSTMYFPDMFRLNIRQDKLYNTVIPERSVPKIIYSEVKLYE